MASQPAYATRTRWRNHTGNQSIDPLRIYTPRSLEELVEIVKEGERLRCPVRCVGSGHSWSDVALTPGFLVKPTGLTRRLELPDVRRDINGSKLVRFEAGIRIRELNAELERSGLALSNMGGYDGQTIAGVISTSTHGSGTSFGPLSDFVRSLDVVASGGAVHRIEPSDGPTDPERYRGGELHQDDDWFRAAVVGMGCMGLIYAVTLAVEPAYWLTETRTLTTWEEVGPALIDGSVLEENRHYELLFNPHRREGRNLVLVTQRNRAQRHPRRPPSRRRNSIPEFLALLPVTPIAVNLLVDLWPSLSPLLLDRALIALADEEYTSASHRVLNIGAANLLPAYSAEIGVPVDERGHHVEAVERIIAIAERRREIGGVYHTAPISLRFVKASPAYMSMMEGRKTMMIELIQMTRTEGGMELLAAYEDGLADLDARPHWGQVNGIRPAQLRTMYPHLDEWRQIHHQLNKSGAFDSPFSRRVGIATDAYAA